MHLLHQFVGFSWRKASAFLLGFMGTAFVASATTITWFVADGKTNLVSGGAPMGSDFRFEVGVFRDGFVPTSANTAQWASKWSRAQRVAYNASTGFYSGIFDVISNAAPFTVGATAWVWGFNGDYNSGQWILFRKTDWTWPAPNPFNPDPPQWSATTANSVVLGTVTTNGMQSAAVTNSSLPNIPWSDWQALELATTSLDGPEEDADGDGASNLLEYVYGTDPLRAGTLPSPTLSTVIVSGQPYLQISIPRRSDRPSAVLAVEVSSNLQDWFSGPSYVTTVSNGLSALVVRDLSILVPPRFARLRATLP